MTYQLSLLPQPTEPAPKRKPSRPAATNHDEAFAAKALRFRREAARRRAELRQAMVREGTR